MLIAPASTTAGSVIISTSTSAPVRVSSSAGRTTVSVAGMMDLAGFAHDFDFFVVAVVAMDEEGEELKIRNQYMLVLLFKDSRKTYKSHEESNNVDNCKCPTRLQHGAVLVDAECPATSASFPAILSKDSQVEINIRAREIGAIRSSDSSEHHDCGYECCDESEIHGRDEEGVVAGSEVAD